MSECTVISNEKDYKTDSYNVLGEGGGKFEIFMFNF